jgi:hypothetical protein
MNNFLHKFDPAAASGKDQRPVVDTFINLTRSKKDFQIPVNYLRNKCIWESDRFLWQECPNSRVFSNLLWMSISCFNYICLFVCLFVCLPFQVTCFFCDELICLVCVGRMKFLEIAQENSKKTINICSCNHFWMFVRNSGCLAAHILQEWTSEHQNLISRQLDEPDTFWCWYLNGSIFKWSF